jgi:NhaP-type Na+/H+ or K+/H+ antiporter
LAEQTERFLQLAPELSLTVVRMAPTAVALAGARLGRPAVVLVGWFGPRGLASVVFALLALEEIGPPAASQAVAVITVTVLLSVIAHGATADPLARRFGPRLSAADGAEHPGRPDVPERRLIRRAPAAASGTDADPARQDR